MDQVRDFLPQYLASNAIALLLLVLAWKRPTAGRISLGVVFLAAGITNAYTAIDAPGSYLDYERLALLELYREFIGGWFAAHVRPMVMLIAAGQVAIATGMFLNRALLRPAVVGALVFLLAIAPLGVGSAFPCSILLAMAAALLWRRHARGPDGSAVAP